MLYEVKGPTAKRPVRVPVRVRDLGQGELAVITEAGSDFGKHVLCVSADDGSGEWIVCLNDAIVGRYSSLYDRICRRMKPPDKVTLVSREREATEEASK